MGSLLRDCWIDSTLYLLAADLFALCLMIAAAASWLSQYPGFLCSCPVAFVAAADGSRRLGMPQPGDNTGWFHFQFLCSVFSLEQFGVRATTLKFRDMEAQSAAHMHAAHVPAEGVVGGSGGGSSSSGDKAVGLPELWHDPQRPLRPAAAALALRQEQQDAALVAALRQRWQEQQLLRHGLLLGAGSSSRQLLAAAQAEQPAGFEAAARPAGIGHRGHSRCWRMAAKCWALRLAKRLGGDAAVLKAQGWVL